MSLFLSFPLIQRYLIYDLETAMLNSQTINQPQTCGIFFSESCFLICLVMVHKKSSYPLLHKLFSLNRFMCSCFNSGVLYSSIPLCFTMHVTCPDHLCLKFKTPNLTLMSRKINIPNIICEIIVYCM